MLPFWLLPLLYYILLGFAWVGFAATGRQSVLGVVWLSQGHRKQKYANGCHFCTLLEKAMQILAFFPSALANRTSL